MRNKEKDKTYWCSKKHCLGSCYRNCDIVELNNRRLKTMAISVVTIGSIVFLIFALSRCDNKQDTLIKNEDAKLYMNPDGNVTTIPIGTPLN